MKMAGVRVEGEIVKTPQHIVAECIGRAPKGFILYDRMETGHWNWRPEKAALGPPRRARTPETL